MTLKIEPLGISLQLLPEKAIYIEQIRSLLVADVHLGKSETFQASGIPIPNQVNQQTLDRLAALCHTWQPDQLIILGDLLHSRFALTDELLAVWSAFLKTIVTPVTLIVGNHDRPLLTSLERLTITCCPEALALGSLILSHDPHPSNDRLNICGHIHPCLRLKTGLDNLRLPCFHLDRSENILTLPAFGEFTGGYEIQLTPNSVAYVVADGAIVPIEQRV